MKKSADTEEQIAFAPEAGGGGSAGGGGHPSDERTGTGLLPLKEVDGGLCVGELRRAKQIEDVKGKPTQLVADLSRDKRIL